MITLWGRNNSTNVKKVLLTLEELELPYEQILAGREFGINHDADFLAMNPNGLVPLLRDDESDLILWESNAIVRYLAAQYGQKRLWIDSPARRAEAEKWMDWANQTLSNAHRGILMGLVRTPPEERIKQAAFLAPFSINFGLGMKYELEGIEPPTVERVKNANQLLHTGI